MFIIESKDQTKSRMLTLDNGYISFTQVLSEIEKKEMIEHFNEANAKKYSKKIKDDFNDIYSSSSQFKLSEYLYGAFTVNSVDSKDSSECQYTFSHYTKIFQYLKLKYNRVYYDDANEEIQIGYISEDDKDCHFSVKPETTTTTQPTATVKSTTTTFELTTTTSIRPIVRGFNMFLYCKLGVLTDKCKTYLYSGGKYILGNIYS